MHRRRIFPAHDGGFERSGFSISGTAGFGQVDYRMRRETVIDTLASQTDARSSELGERVSAQIQGYGTVEKPGGNEFGGFLGVKVAF